MLAQAFAGQPSSSFSSASLVERHNDALSALSPHISLYKPRSGSEYAGDMTSYYQREMLAAFHYSQQILHLPYNLCEFSANHETTIDR